MAMPLLPKVLALIDLARNRTRRRAFGGMAHAGFWGSGGDGLFHLACAFANAAWHSQFVAASLLLFGVHWGPQNRGADGILMACFTETLGAHQ